MSDRITPSNIEGKLREIQAEVDTAATTAKPAGIGIGVGVLAAAVGVAFVIGQRKGNKRTTIVEVRRV